MSKRFVKEEIDRFHDYGLYISKRTIYLGSIEYSAAGDESGTDGAMAEQLIKNLFLLQSMGQEPITIITNNMGGDEYHGLAIFDAIRECKSEVSMIVYGHAMSMGSVILQAADRRIMAPTSRQMIHYGTSSIDAHNKTVQKWAKEGKRNDTWTEQLYLEKIREKHPKFSLRQLQKMLDHDTFMTARESVNLGLADAVLGEENE